MVIVKSWTLIYITSNSSSLHVVLGYNLSDTLIELHFKHSVISVRHCTKGYRSPVALRGELRLASASVA